MGTISDISANRFKRLDYDYDLISGNVHRVDYQTGMKDQWHHAYLYDADNRITDVFTTSSTPMADVEKTSHYSLENEAGLTPYWDKEASYNYYDHGPLARIELGEEQVQGLDYYYTLQGWVKGVNSNTLLETSDPGGDGDGTSANHGVAKDAYGFSLDYFDGDYSNISGDAEMFPTGGTAPAFDNLYNGNIGKMVTSIRNPNTYSSWPITNIYHYDQLNRLLNATGLDIMDPGNNLWAGEGDDADISYSNTFSYDANGNIVSQTRTNMTNTVIDQLTYQYRKNSDGKILQNRLYHVNDNSSDLTPGELTDQGAFTQSDVNTNNNYGYDGEGRLIRDDEEQIDNILWRVDGKVKEIQRPAGSGKKNVSFDYDAMGHRIAKHVYDDAWSLQKSTYYVLDAHGNAIGVYERAVDEEAEEVTFALKEQYIYGSNRVGVRNTDINLLSTTMPLPASSYQSHDIGYKAFELTNHLGNVLSTVSDKITPIKDSTQLYSNDFSSILSPFAASSSTAVSLDAGTMKVDCSVHYSNSHMTLTTVPGKSYRVYFSIDLNAGGTVGAFVRDLSTGHNVGLKFAVVNGPSYFDFTATNTSLFFAFENEFNGARVFHVDNIRVEEYDITGYVADIRTSSDYCPFGASMRERNFTLSGAEEFRFGYQGSEMDGEINNKAGNTYKLPNSSGERNILRSSKAGNNTGSACQRSSSTAKS